MQELFANLASNPRLSILCYLHNKEGRNSDISEKLGMSLQAIHRHVKTLQTSGLIRRDLEGHLSITNFGYAILSQIPAFQFLWKNKKYFEEHSITKLPFDSIQTIGALNDCEIIHGTAAIVEKWKTMIMDADRYIKIITGQVILDLAKYAADKVKSGVKMNYILGQNTIIPKGRSEMNNKLGLKKLIADGLVERKMADMVYVNLIITEKESAINFSRTDNTLDLSSNFYSKNTQFHAWTVKLFDTIWNQSGTFNESKIIER